MQLQPPGLTAPQDSMQSGPPAQSGAEGDYPGSFLENSWTEETGGLQSMGLQSQLNGHGFGWTLGVGDGQGGLACCNPADDAKNKQMEPN